MLWSVHEPLAKTKEYLCRMDTERFHMRETVKVKYLQNNLWQGLDLAHYHTSNWRRTSLFSDCDKCAFKRIKTLPGGQENVFLIKIHLKSQTPSEPNFYYCSTNCLHPHVWTSIWNTLLSLQTGPVQMCCGVNAAPCREGYSTPTYKISPLKISSYRLPPIRISSASKGSARQQLPPLQSTNERTRARLWLSVERVQRP